MSKAVQKTVLITGCSKGGIGDALAQEFHRKGLRVFATARNPDKIKHLEALGINIFVFDVIDEVSIKNAVEIVNQSTGGTLDLLVNNSGAGNDSHIITLPSQCMLYEHPLLTKSKDIHYRY
jgi:1-acylglycerone phosphate reductase